jgi:hypothetical protein
MKTPDLLSRQETASLLGLKTATLEAWATDGIGPEFIKLGTGRSARVRYPRRGIQRFLTSPAKYLPARGRKPKSSGTSPAGKKGRVT